MLQRSWHFSSAAHSAKEHPLINPHALCTRKMEIIYQWLSSSECNANQGKAVKKESFTTPDTPPHRKPRDSGSSRTDQYNLSPGGRRWLVQLSLKLGLFLYRWQKHWPPPALWKGTCFPCIQVDSHSLPAKVDSLAPSWASLTVSFILKNL